MKSLVGALLFTTSAMALGAVVATEASLLIAAQGIGADTTIEGLTIGLLVALVIAGLALLWKGARVLLRLGGDLAKWRDGLDRATELAPLVRDITERLERLERWRIEIGRRGVGEKRSGGGSSA